MPAGGIVFTTIQKFRRPRARKMPVLSERSNIIVIADEAHRSQYDSFAENITLALPNATRIGFTGTPIEKADRSTAAGLRRLHLRLPDARGAGGQRHRPDLLRDAARSAWTSPTRTSSSTSRRSSKTRRTRRARKLVTAWAQAGEGRRRSRTGWPRSPTTSPAHYNDALRGARRQGHGRRLLAPIAAAADRLLRERLGEDAVDCVISAQATDDPRSRDFRRSKKELQRPGQALQGPGRSTLRFVVVQDMWLTGFDAPALHTLYIDKPMRDHGLLQAIARVNRVFQRQARRPRRRLHRHRRGPARLAAGLRRRRFDDARHPAQGASRGSGRSTRSSATCCTRSATAQGELHLVSRQASFFARRPQPSSWNDDDHETFLDEQPRSPSGTRSRAPSRRRSTLKTRSASSTAWRPRSASTRRPTAQASKEAEQAVRQFLSEGLAAGEVVDVFGLADKDRPEISVLSDDFLDSIGAQTGPRNIQHQAAPEAARRRAQGPPRTNHLQAKEFSEEIEALLRRYEQPRSSPAPRSSSGSSSSPSASATPRHRHEELGLTEEEAAFYDALAGGVEHVKADPKLAALAHELAENIRKDLRVDWTDREATEATIRTKIKRLLRRNRDKLPKLQPTAATAPTGGGDGRRRHQLLHTARARPGQGDVPLLARGRRPTLRRDLVERTETPR